MGNVSRLGNIFEDVAIKAPARLAATAAVAALNGLPTIDGVATADGDRVLLTAQSDPTLNGLWQVSTGNWIRTADGANNTDFIDGTLVPVARGTANAGQLYMLQCTDSPIVVGTSQLVFVAQSSVMSAQQRATSTSSAAVSTGAKTFAIQTGKAFAANQYVLIYETSAPANAMLAQISGYSGASLAVNVVATGGSGTHADWTIVLTNSAASAGLIPPIGVGNVTGPGTAISGHLPVFADGTGKVLVDSGIAAGTLASRNTLAYGDAGAASIGAASLVPGDAPLPYCGVQPADNLRLVIDLTNPTRDINVTAGRCRSDGDAMNLHLAGTMVKRLDQAWVAGGSSGSPRGCCDTGVKGGSQAWHIYLIAKPGRTITQYSRTSNVATVTVAAHGGGAGGTVRAYGIGFGFDAIGVIASVATNTISYANSGPDVGATSVTSVCDLFDIVASQSYPTPTLPSGWTVKQCLGTFLTDGSANIRNMTQVGDKFLLAIPVVDVNGGSSTTATAYALTVPGGVAVNALLRAGLACTSATALLIYTFYENVLPPFLGGDAELSAGIGGYANGNFEKLTSTSGQIGLLGSNNGGATMNVLTLGWRDPRRRLF